MYMCPRRDMVAVECLNGMVYFFVFIIESARS